MSAMGVLSGHVLLTMSFVGRDPNRVQKGIVKFIADERGPIEGIRPPFWVPCPCRFLSIAGQRFDFVFTAPEPVAPFSVERK